MDSFTHLVLGAALGEAVLGKKIGREAMFWGAVANTIPDFDVFTSPCVSAPTQMLIHRGITHSFFFALIVAWVLSYLFAFWKKRLNVSRKGWFALFFIGMISHDLIDSLTCYGTGWFEPFSSYRVAFDTIFVLDPFYTIPFLICVLIALIAKNGSDKRIKWTKMGLYISSTYLLFTIINKAHVHSTIKHALENNNYSADNFVTTPTPLNNLLWMSYAVDSAGYRFGYYSILDKNDNIQFFYLDKKEHLLEPFNKQKEVQQLKQFSQGYYCLTKEGNDVFFNDLRFGQIRGWDEPDSSFVFAYNLSNPKDEGNRNPLNRHKIRDSYPVALKSLITRAKGKQ